MSHLLNKKSVIKVKEYFLNNKIDIDLIVLNESGRTAVDAANSLNKEVGSIVKSLLVKDEIKNKFYLCLVSGDKYMSLNKLSKITNTNIVKANADECKKITGFSIGGVPPIGHLIPPKNIFIDNNLNKYEIIYAAAGHSHVVFGTSYENLCTMTNAIESDITT